MFTANTSCPCFAEDELCEDCAWKFYLDCASATFAKSERDEFETEFLDKIIAQVYDL